MRNILRIYRFICILPAVTYEGDIMFGDHTFGIYGSTEGDEMTAFTRDGPPAGEERKFCGSVWAAFCGRFRNRSGCILFCVHFRVQF